MKPLRQYFSLRFTLLKRHIVEFGVNPIVGFGLGLILFYGLSYQLFTKTPFAGYLYVFVAVSFLFAYAETERNNFLRFTFPGKSFRTIRIVENIVLSTPFLIFLLGKGQWLPVCILTVVSLVLAFVNAPLKYTLILPTPFYQKPFEFIVGFRTYFGLFVLAYSLTGIAVVYQNFNLGVFSLLLIFLTCLSFYNEPEKEFFVWVHTLKPGPFLLDKIKTALFFSTLLCLPTALTLLLFFTPYFVAIMGFWLLGYCYLLTILLAKYAAYPQKMSIGQAILAGCSFILPPMLLFIAPYFYLHAVKKLKVLLDATN